MPPTFDLIVSPDLIRPDYGFYAVFVGAGIVLATMTTLAVRLHWRWRKYLCVFAPLWIIGSGTLLFFDARDVLQVRELVKQGHYSVLEGCLQSFHPGSPTGSKTTSGHEHWSVAGHGFDYGQGQALPYYHAVQARDGLVHSTSRVRVSFVISPYYGDEKIVRLEALAPPCPAAPDEG
ncbi:hypothetical protein WG901_23385 [Novosphingobium sp. PS1R-30]|uniref:DUF3592 domain-containing protein n=1 Tax=Novosphingobium anseongense TaxID=3133436 RepID=A0ABU8S2P1_9SPHN